MLYCPPSLQVAAAATVVLAHSWLSQPDDTDWSFGLDVAMRITAALVRPGMPAALAACHSEDYAAGVLAAAVVQEHSAHASTAGQPRESFIRELVLKLGKWLPAVLEAPANNCRQGRRPLQRRVAAAKLLQDLSQTPDRSPEILRILLPPAAGFLSRLASDLQSSPALSGKVAADSSSDGGTCDGAAATTDAGSDGGGGGSRISQAANPAHLTEAYSSALQHLAAAGSLAAGGALALLSARPGDASAEVAASATAAANCVARLYAAALRLFAVLPATPLSPAAAAVLAVLPPDACPGVLPVLRRANDGTCEVLHQVNVLSFLKHCFSNVAPCSSNEITYCTKKS